MIFIYSNILFLILYLTGRAFSLIYINFFVKSYDLNVIEENNNYLKYIYPLIGLFTVGNLLIIFNFFVNLSSIKFLFFIFLLLLLLYNLNYLPNKNNLIKYFTLVIPVQTILTISIFGKKIHYDALVYKLQYQNWIQESKIVFGLTNFRDLLGLTGIMEYISSLVWVGKNLVIIHLISVSVLTTFFVFLMVYLFKLKKDFLFFSSCLIIIYSLLDNVGVGGGANGFLKFQMIGTYDLLFGVLFFFGNIIMFQNIIESNYNKFDFFLVNLLLLFAFQVRIFALASIFLYTHYVYKNIIYTKVNFFKLAKNISILFFFLLTFLIRNFIISGCFIIPLQQTCISSVKWVSSLFQMSESGLKYYIAYPLGTNLIEWFNAWITIPKNFQIFSNFIISLIVIILGCLIFFKFEINLKNNSIFGYNLIFVWLFFMVTGPTPRFGMGIFLITLISIAVIISELRINLKNNLLKGLIIIFSFLAVLGVPRGYTYVLMLEDKSLNYQVLIPEFEFRESKVSWGVEPTVKKDLEKCGAVYNCFANKERRTPFKYGSYLLFINN